MCFLVKVFFIALISIGVQAVESDRQNSGHHQAEGNGHPAVEPKNRMLTDYAFPQVKLTREDGKEVQFPAEVDDGRSVVMTFIFTTCRTICPIMSHVFANLQKKLGANVDQVHMVSITIDPEYDTPARLADYAKSLKAGKQWNHYTGDLKSIIRVEKAFDVYAGDKMNHLQVYYLRSRGSDQWVRLQGYIDADDLLRELAL